MSDRLRRILETAEVRRDGYDYVAAGRRYETEHQARVALWHALGRPS